MFSAAPEARRLLGRLSDAKTEKTPCELETDDVALGPAS